MTGQEKQYRRILSLSLQKATVPSDKSAVVQIAKTVQWIETCWKRSSEEGSEAAKSKIKIGKPTCRYLA